MNSSDKAKWQSLLSKIRKQYPEIQFVKSTKSLWSKSELTIEYHLKDSFHDGFASLFHEIGHMELNHSKYNQDVQLIRLETQAWTQAQTIAKKHNLTIAQDYIDKCLDSYRDWLHLRSRCPNCSTQGIQKDSHKYICLNCAQNWQVTNSKFCRTYRSKLKDPA